MSSNTVTHSFTVTTDGTSGDGKPKITVSGDNGATKSATVPTMVTLIDPTTDETAGTTSATNDVELDQLLELNKRKNNLSQTATLSSVQISNQTSSDDNRITVRYDATAPIVVVFPVEAAAEKTWWQKMQTVALLLIFVVVLLTVIRCAYSFFTGESSGADAGADGSQRDSELAPAIAVANKLD